jgi:glycosyltransferase involved in cell wall biosynthesis
VRILHVIQELGPGGAEHMVRRLCATSPSGAYQFAIACAGSAGVPAGVLHVPLPMVRRRPATVLAAGWRLRRFVSEWQPDVVHAHNPTMAVIVAIAMRRGRARAGLVTLHGVPPADDAATARLLRWTRLSVIACGPGVASALRQHGTSPFRTVANGISPPPQAAAAADVRRQWGLPNDARLIVAAGRLAPQKRHDLAVSALTRVRGTGLLIVGTGPLRQQLQRQVEELGLDGRVRLIGAYPNVRTILGAADAVVQPSDWEGLPLVVLEAMSAARPVIAARSRGLRELIRDGVDGLLVDPGDANALAAGINAVLDDAALATRLGEAAAARVDEEFSETAMVSAYQALWEALAPSARPSVSR